MKNNVINGYRLIDTAEIYGNEARKFKAIGVSNFEIHHLEVLLSYAKVVPVYF